MSNRRSAHDAPSGRTIPRPATAVSGVYMARLVLDGGGSANGDSNQIPFIVRDDGGTSDVTLVVRGRLDDAGELWTSPVEEEWAASRPRGAVAQPT